MRSCRAAAFHSQALRPYARAARRIALRNVSRAPDAADVAHARKVVSHRQGQTAFGSQLDDATQAAAMAGDLAGQVDENVLELPDVFGDQKALSLRVGRWIAATGRWPGRRLRPIER